MPAIGMVVAAGIAAYSQNRTNAANRRAAAGQGYVDTTTTRNPYPGTEGYRSDAMQAAHDALFGGGSGIAGDPNAAGATRAKAPAGYRYNASGRLVAAKNAGATTAAGGSVPSAPFNGQSQETRDIQAKMSALPGQESDMYGAEETYNKNLLAGRSTNPLLDPAAAAANAISEDPRLAAYEDTLMGELGIGGKAAGGGGGTVPTSQIWTGNPSGGTGGWGGSGSTTGPGGAGYTSATGADAAIRDLIAGKDAPGLKAAEDAVANRVAMERAGNIRELKARGVGSGMYGGDYYKSLEEGAVAQGDQQLANELAAQRFGAYQNALGLGEQYDLGMADIAARDRATSASAGASAANTALQRRLAAMGALGDALQLGTQGRTSKAGALGDLAGLFSNDQQAAAGGIDRLGGSRRSDLAAAGDLSLGSDQARNQYIASQNQLRAAQIAGGNQRAELQFEKERFYDPFSRLGAYTDILGNLYGGYGSETTTGRDTRSTSPPAYSSPIGAAFGGAALGGQVGSAYSYKPRTTNSQADVNSAVAAMGDRGW